MMEKYILDENRKPVVEPDLLKWAEWFETAERHVRDTTVNGVRVSTIFLGLDHNFFEEGLPILWETMIFGGEHDRYQRRYCSEEAAIQGHMEALSMLDGWNKDMEELKKICGDLNFQNVP